MEDVPVVSVVQGSRLSSARFSCFFRILNCSALLRFKPLAALWVESS